MKSMLIVEDHPSMVLVIQEMLTEIVGKTEVSSVLNLHELQRTTPNSVDIVVFDLNMPGSSPEEVLKETSSRFPMSRRICFTADDREATQALVAEHGALFLSKSLAYKDLITKIQGYLGSNVVSTDIDLKRNDFQSLIQAPGATKPLTLKQVAVLNLVTEGKTSKEIARELSMSPDTVRAHIKGAFDRLGTSNRSAAVQVFLQAKKLAERIHGSEALC